MQCKCCGSKNLKEFLFKENVPILQNILYRHKVEALSANCATLKLMQCEICGMVHNAAFKGVPYGENYENNQLHSATFASYIKSIIKLLIEKYHIKNSKIIEIGCGNGEFLKALAKSSKSVGIGYDPSFRLDNIKMGGGSR